jgi:hypothetical protein
MILIDKYAMLADDGSLWISCCTGVAEGSNYVCHGVRDL